LVEPSALACQALEQVDALAIENGVELVAPTLGALGNVSVDDEKFTRVLVNLLANAIKFTPKGGRVSLSLSKISDNTGAAVVFTVRDTGMGIHTSDARRIFDEGVKVNESVPTRESAGLGLTYCKRMTEAHGGAVWCDSIFGKGSAFFVRIPCAQLHEESMPT
jgi:signal transduction histidine kinase